MLRPVFKVQNGRFELSKGSLEVKVGNGSWLRDPQLVIVRKLKLRELTAVHCQVLPAAVARRLAVARRANFNRASGPRTETPQ